MNLPGVREAAERARARLGLATAREAFPRSRATRVERAASRTPSREHEDASAVMKDAALYISEREHDALRVARAARRELEEGDAVVV